MRIPQQKLSLYGERVPLQIDRDNPAQFRATIHARYDHTTIYDPTLVITKGGPCHYLKLSNLQSRPRPDVSKEGWFCLLR